MNLYRLTNQFWILTFWDTDNFSLNYQDILNLHLRSAIEKGTCLLQFLDSCLYLIKAHDNI